MIVGELKCSCANGSIVVAQMPDGLEIVTDAEGFRPEDVSAWHGRVLARAEKLPHVQRLRVLVLMKLDFILASTRLSLRTCPDCDGKGWLFCLHVDAPQDGQSASDAAVAEM